MEHAKNLKFSLPFQLESGEVLEELILSYHLMGKMNDAKDNIIWVFHALSANSNPFEWWPGLFGEGCLYNLDEYCVICVNSIGSPYGNSRPQNLDFPFYTVRDVVKTQLMLADSLGITHIHTAIGGSFGGNQALEFAYAYRGIIAHLVLIASSAKESAWSIAIHESQRLTLQADSSFGMKGEGKAGLKAARAIGMLTYRTNTLFDQTQTDEESKLTGFKAASYIQYQGEKFERRFDAICYHYLLNCLDTHDVGRKRNGVEKALESININTLVIGIDTDMLVPPRLQKNMVDHIPNARYKEIESDFGHDGFLIETEAITKELTHFYRNTAV